MIQKLQLLVLTLCFLNLNGFAQVFEEKTVNVGNLGLTVSNVGSIGRPNVRNNPKGPPSMEYPLNSGIEHLFEAGIWVGAQVAGQTLVSTGSVDDPSGYATGKAGYEYTPLPGKAVLERSSLTSSEKFSLQSISHQDFVFSFTDSFVVVPNTSQPISNHLNPLKVEIELTTHAWNFSFADFFVIMSYEITNRSDETWDSVYTGIWSDIVVRNVNVTTDQGSAFFSKGAVGFVDTMHAVYAYDVNGDPGFTESYGSIQHLGTDWRGEYIHPNNAAKLMAKGLPEPRINGNYWTYNIQAPIDDLQRYDRMKTHADFKDPILANAANRVQLICAGPLTAVEPGETFTATYAFVCAKQLFDNPKNTYLARTELRDNLGWAKRTFIGEDLNENGELDAGEDLNSNAVLDRYILPEPPATPKVRIIPGNQKVDIYWDNVAASSIDPISKKRDFEGYKLYRTKLGDDLNLNLLASAQLIAQWDKKGNGVGFNNGFEEVALPQIKKFEGDTSSYLYKFTTDKILNGWQYMYILTSFDSGDELLGLPALESSFIQNAKRVIAGTPSSEEDAEIGVYPNPYRTEAAWDGSTSRSKKLIFFNLPAKAEIVVYTVAGDIIAILNHDSENAYNGSSAAWYDNFATTDVNQAGGEHAWDILSDSKQAISSGLYLFTVTNTENGKVKQGKFVVIK